MFLIEIRTILLFGLAAASLAPNQAREAQPRLQRGTESATFLRPASLREDQTKAGNNPIPRNATITLSQGLAATYAPAANHSLQDGKYAPIAQDLAEAILRIEPIFDPTRLNEADNHPFTVRAGTAVMNNVFADRWRRLSRDPNINANPRYLAFSWHEGDDVTCDAFTKNRARGFDEVVLNALDQQDCGQLMSDVSRDLVELAPLSPGATQVAIFAAPLPGARMASGAFWAQRREKVRMIEGHLQRKWEDWPPHRVFQGKADP